MPATLRTAVIATDAGAIPQIASTTFTLTVTGALPWHQTVSAADYMRYAEEYGAEPPYDEYYNRPPLFLEGATTMREMDENSPAGTEVGEPVTACDPLRYVTLDGEDGEAFDLDITI